MLDVMEEYRRRLFELGLDLPDLPVPRGRYVAAGHHGDQLWLSGVTGRTAEAPATRGVVGDDITIEQARASARLAATNLIAGVAASGVAAAVTGVLFLRGYVRAVASFGEHPIVVDAASEVLEAVIGGGPHARAAIGVASLPGGACVELEAVLRLRSGR
jgi:enamine deaminase RidA (YjgF/YER057c/UK114 family)